MSEKEKLLKRKIIFCLNKFSQTATFDEIKETAIPSYVHPNPLVRQIFWQRIFVILNQINKLSPKSVLDFGCGSGIVTAILNSRIDRFVIDIFYEPFDFMRRCLGLQNVNKLYPRDLDSKKFRFDLILAADVLEHLKGDEITRYIKLFHRQLSSGGHLIISGPTENLMYKIGRFIAGYKNDYHKTNIKNIGTIIINSGLFKLHSRKRRPIPLLAEGFWILTFVKI